MTNIQKELQSKIEAMAIKKGRHFCSTGQGDLDRSIKYFLQIGYEDGALSIAVQLAKAVEALKKSIEFGEYTEWAIEESRELQKLDEDARDFLEEHERWMNEK